MAGHAPGLLTAGMLNAPLGAVRGAAKRSDFPVGTVFELRDDPELSILVPARTTWALKTFLIYSATAVSQLQLRIATPSGTEGLICDGTLASDATTNNGKVNMFAFPVSDRFTLPAIATPLACLPWGYLKTASTPGPVTVQFASFYSGDSTNAILHAGSWMTLTRVG